MSDILIPMPDSRGHDMHDDCADFAVQEYSPRPFIPQGADQQGRYVPTIPAEACSELGADADEQMRSADGIGFVYIAVGAICWVCFIVWAIAGGPNA